MGNTIWFYVPVVKDGIPRPCPGLSHVLELHLPPIQSLCWEPHPWTSREDLYLPCVVLRVSLAWILSPCFQRLENTIALCSETLHQSLFTGTVSVPGLTRPSRSLFFFYNSGSFCLLSRPRFHWLTWLFLFHLWLRQGSCLPRREMKQTSREYRKEKEALSLKLCFFCWTPRYNSSFLSMGLTDTGPASYLIWRVKWSLGPRLF